MQSTIVRPYDKDITIKRLNTEVDLKKRIWGLNVCPSRTKYVITPGIFTDTFDSVVVHKNY